MKHSCLSDPFISYKESKVLWIGLQVLKTLLFNNLIKYKGSIIILSNETCLHDQTENVNKTPYKGYLAWVFELNNLLVGSCLVSIIALIDLGINFSIIFIIYQSTNFPS
jgi:hypothetical protein